MNTTKARTIRERRNTMNKDIVSAWDRNQAKVRDWIATVKTNDFSYYSLLENTLRILFEDDDDSYGLPDYRRITGIDHGNYQGTLVFVIGGRGYQPIVENHWYTSVYYGSCSGCDTLLSISRYSCELPSDDQVQQYWTLCLHMIQKMKRMTD
jgi:hypothetical protein